VWRSSGGEPQAALAAPVPQDGATGTRAHAQTETVRLVSAPVVRLKGALAHGRLRKSSSSSGCDWPVQRNWAGPGDGQTALVGASPTSPRYGWLRRGSNRSVQPQAYPASRRIGREGEKVERGSHRGRSGATRAGRRAGWRGRPGRPSPVDNCLLASARCCYLLPEPIADGDVRKTSLVQVRAGRGTPPDRSLN